MNGNTISDFDINLLVSNSLNTGTVGDTRVPTSRIVPKLSNILHIRRNVTSKTENMRTNLKLMV